MIKCDVAFDRNSAQNDDQIVRGHRARAIARASKRAASPIRFTSNDVGKKARGTHGAKVSLEQGCAT